MANDGTLPHAEDIAFTSHARLAKYVMDEARHNAVTNPLVPLPFQQLQFCMTFFLTDQLTCVAANSSDKVIADKLKCLKEQQEKVQHALETVSGSLTGERLSVALEIMRALHVYEIVGVQAAALTQQMTSEQFELTSLAFKRKMEQGKSAVSKLQAETVMSVVVTGTRGGCENSCGDDTNHVLGKSASWKRTTVT